MVKIYIASPYTYGDKTDNVNLQIDAAEIIASHGYAPMVPLFNHFWQIRHSHTETDWLKLDFVWLSCCDILVRFRPIVNGKELPSSGADAEEKFAREIGLPVFTFTNLAELADFLDNNEFVPGTDQAQIDKQRTPIDLTEV